MENNLTSSDVEPARRDIAICRVFDASREGIWKVWTRPELIKLWWGPKGFTSPFCKIDLQVSGKYLYCMRSPAGKDYWATGVFEEIIPLERIVCTDSFANEEGEVVPATYYGLSPDFPLEMRLTVTFEEYGGKTQFTLKVSGIDNLKEKDREDMEQGWNESLDKFDETLQKSIVSLI